MRILLISQYFWPENFRVNDLAQGLAEKGHKVTVLTGKPNYPEGKYYPGYNFFNKSVEDYNSIRVVRVPLISRGKSKIRLILNYLSFAFFSTLFSPFLCKESYDVIFVMQYSPVTVALPAIFLKKLKKLPLIMWVQDLWPESLQITVGINSGLTYRRIDKLVAWIYRHCNLLLIQSELFAESIKAKYPEARIKYLPNWAEDIYYTDYCHEDDIKQEESLTILHAGNIGLAQEFETVLVAAEELKDLNIKWLFVGEGSRKDWLQEEIMKRGLAERVQLLGKYPLSEMPAFYARADAFLVTLKPNPIISLTIPSKIQSYLACGKPIIGVLEGAGRNVIIEAQAGVVSSTGNTDLLANNIRKLYKLSKAERAELGSRGKAYYEANFAREILLDRIERIIKDLQKGLNKQ